MCNQNRQKVPKVTYFDLYFTKYLGHIDLLFKIPINLHNTNNDYHIQRLCANKWSNVTSKSSKRHKKTYILTYISLNIGHRDLIFGRLMDIFNTINNYHIWRFCNQNCQNVPPKSSKTSKNDIFLTYISRNIGHSDLIFCMQIDIPNTINNYHTQRFHDQKWQNVPPKFTDDGRQTKTIV